MTGDPGPVAGRPVPITPALIVGQVTHSRHVGVKDHFRYRSLQWLVDIDEVPELTIGRRSYQLRAADHLSSNGFRSDLAALLQQSDIELDPTDRVLLLAHPRSSGYVFDPLSVFWCFDIDGGIRAVVLEVHNTYGERHAYVLPGSTSSRVDKDFYVSPFNDTGGEYRVRWQLDPEHVQVTVNLHRDDRLVLAATVGGGVQALTTSTMRRGARRVRGMPYRVPVLIRWRAIRLWARRLPIRQRPANGGNLPTTVSCPRAGQPAPPRTR